MQIKKTLTVYLSLFIWALFGGLVVLFGLEYCGFSEYLSYFIDVDLFFTAVNILLFCVPFFTWVATFHLSRAKNMDIEKSLRRANKLFFFSLIFSFVVILFFYLSSSRSSIPPEPVMAVPVYGVYF